METTARDPESFRIATQTGAPRIAIIGSGFSGLSLGIHLRKEGIRSFRIYEKASRVGGTWRENTYPGCACDVASFAYCFSFEQKTDWSRKWSPQGEILQYMEHCVDRYGLSEHLRFDSEIAGARYDEAAHVWHVRAASGEEFVADVVVSCVGQLHRPHIPDIEGLDAFQGKVFHSARWDHQHDLAGKQVAVVGNAASAIQFVPHVARQAARLHVFQRSANWMMPRGDRAYTPAEKERFRRYPWLARAYRWWIWFAHELWFPIFRRNAFLSGQWERGAVKYLESVVQDPALRQALTPDYPIGAKRILISDDYFQALTRPNVELIRDGVARLNANSIVTRSGREIPIDTLILATGFRTTEFLVPMQIEGCGGRSLHDAWSDGARAYYGMTVSGFPNFFMMYGPNTNLGHNSIIFMIECQTTYIMDLLRKMRSQNIAAVDLRPEVMEAYNRRLQERLSRTAWAAVDKSWYKDSAGHITNNWSGTTTTYWWHTRQANLSDYRTTARTAIAKPATAADAESSRAAA
ncbi:MAG TPA: NAD(P)/FAD-dependent oxidoreductase [Candidatus Binatia bacterium]|nr:NAD(P)/FAD-dependent oxidoreductase [Candidatus Binatia bacterium]